MDNDARRFRNEMSRQAGQKRDMQSRNNQVSRQGRVDNTIQFPQKYTAQRGTAHRAQARRKNKKLNLKLASLILATSIGIGGLTLANKNKEVPSITDLSQMGITHEELDLAEDTISTMEKYDEYFENFDHKTTNLSETEIITMIEDIRSINEDVIREKMADLVGVEKTQVTLSHFFDKGSEKYYTAVLIDGGKQRYDNSYGILGNDHTIPKDLSYSIEQIDSYGTIIEDVQSDKITKANAVKKLKEKYEDISKIAGKDFSMDAKGNVKLQDYEAKQTEKNVDREESR